MKEPYAMDPSMQWCLDPTKGCLIQKCPYNSSSCSACKDCLYSKKGKRAEVYKSRFPEEASRVRHFAKQRALKKDKNFRETTLKAAIKVAKEALDLSTGKRQQEERDYDSIIKDLKSLVSKL